MKWFRGERRSDRSEREARLVEAEEEVARIRVRAERVAPALERRLRRNHWGNAAIAIARREH